MSDNLVFGLKIASTALLGLYAGGSLCISTCTVPANLDCPDVYISRNNWSRNFGYESRVMPSIHMAALASALGYYFLTRGTKEEDLPFLLSALAGEINLPITLAILMPVNKQLDNEEECKEKGKEHTNKLLRQWGARHNVRTVVGVASFVYALYRFNTGGK